MTSGPGELVAVGRVGRAHGLRGEVSVIPWTDNPQERFVVGVELVVGTGQGRILVDTPPLRIETARVHSGRWLLGFADVIDRNGAEALHGRTLLLPAVARAAIADPDEFYDSDLVGLAARTADDVDLGRVTEVVHGPGGDYLVLTGPPGTSPAPGAPARAHLVPFVSQIVPVVDIAAGTITVDPPEGLFQL